MAARVDRRIPYYDVNNSFHNKAQKTSGLAHRCLKHADAPLTRFVDHRERKFHKANAFPILDHPYRVLTSKPIVHTSGQSSFSTSSIAHYRIQHQPVVVTLALKRSFQISSSSSLESHPENSLKLPKTPSASATTGESSHPRISSSSFSPYPNGSSSTSADSRAFAKRPAIPRLNLSGII